MWSYTAISFINIGRGLGTIGLVCSILHALSPYMYRKFKSKELAVYVMVSSGLVFQWSFAFLTGGFYAPTLLWVAVLPLIVAVITDVKHTVIWTGISLASFIVMFFLHQPLGLSEAFLESEARTPLYQFMIGGGLIMTNGLFAIFLVKVGVHFSEKQKSQNQRIRSLMRTISHDLSNPLGVIQLRNFRLQDEKIGKALEIIDHILKAAKDLDAVEVGKFDLDRKPTRLGFFKENALFIFEEKLKEKSIVINWSEFNENIVVMVDPVSFANQIFNNLISNAIKFSYLNSEIKIKTHQKGAFCFLGIEDHGQGMTEKQVSQLFQENLPTSSRGTSGEQGTGFGLLICKSYLEAQNGRIEVHSQKEKGTEVVLEIPMASSVQ